MKIFSVLLLFFSLLGVLFFGILVHELVHIIQDKEPVSICYDINQDSIMHVNIVKEEDKHNGESLAYTISTIVTLLLMSYIIVRITA